MAKIEVGKYSDLLRRTLAMAGVVQVAQELAPEIAPVFVLESERPEWEFLKGAKLLSSQVSVTAAPAVFPKGRLRNPPGSGVMAILDAFNFVTGLESVINLWRVTTTTDMTGAAGTVCRDTRFPALNNSALIASQEATAGALSGDHFLHTVSQAQREWRLPLVFILTPGFAIDIGGETVNSSLRANFHWLERPMGALEVA